MRASAATTGLVTAAALLAPGCGPAATPEPSQGEPVRRASFRSIAARHFLATCPGSAARPDTLSQVERLEELKQLAYRNGAGRALLLGENDWAAVSRYSHREPCRPGEAAYRQALTAFSGTLDVLAGRIAEHSQ